MGIVYLLWYFIYFNCILKIGKKLKCMTFSITIIVQKINCGNENMGREKQDTNYF